MDPTVPPFPEPKKRPSVWWFPLGVALLIGAVAVGGVLAYQLFDEFLRIEARVPADDQAHSVAVESDQDQFLWMEETTPADCVIRDAVRGDEISVGPVSGTFSRTGGSGSWVADGIFNPGSGQLSVTCDSAGGPVEIGPAWDVSEFVTSLLLIILVPMALGGLGLLILVVVGILFAVRPART